ncbi:MAG TPA: XdhC family protein [Verrucomicrobiae bacterium]|nr:XdhC family protein [Verrucomicrobiae bacterium]
MMAYPAAVQNVYHALAEAARNAEPVALGIITTVKGSSPQKLGAKAIFHSDGRITGTLGGGCLEAEIQHRAMAALRSAEPEAFDLLLDHDFGWDDGLICGGKVGGVILPNAQAAGVSFWERIAKRAERYSWEVSADYSIRTSDSTVDSAVLYREEVHPPCVLWIAGAGHIAQAVAPLAASLDFDVTVFDDRPALASRDYFPSAINLQTGMWDELCAMRLPPVPAFALIVTRGHRHDALVLKDWIQQPFLFLGMIGSARKARTIFEHFREEQIATEEQLQRVACPVGIRIRSQSVPEISVSIMAQFIEKRAELVFDRRKSGLLRVA